MPAVMNSSTHSSSRGRLRRGFDILSGLIDPFDRAVFAMFLVSEVHPFDDGNGRVARLAPSEHAIR